MGARRRAASRHRGFTQRSAEFWATPTEHIHIDNVKTPQTSFLYYDARYTADLDLEKSRAHRTQVDVSGKAIVDF